MRPKRACISCNKRKQKCDLDRPCSRCIKINVDCIYNNIQSTKHIKKDKIKGKDIDRLDKKWSKIEDMVEACKTILISPPNSSNSTISIAKLENFSLNNKREYNEINLGNNKLIQDEFLQSELMNIYFVYHHPSKPFLNEKRVRLLINSEDDGDRALIASIYAISLKTYNYLNGLSLIDIDDNPYYLKARKLTSEFTRPNLSVLQAMLIQEILEMGNSRPFRGACLSAEAIKIGHILGLHNLNYDAEPSELDETQMELVKSWLQCLYLDQLSSVYFSKPSHFKLQDLTSIEEDLIQRLAKIGKKNLRVKAEEECINIHFVHHLVKLKSHSMCDNNKLQNGNYDLRKFYNILKNFKKCAKLELSDDKIDLNSKHYKEDINSFDDYTFVSSFVKTNLKLAICLYSNFIISKIFEFGDDDQIMLSLEYRAKARKTAHYFYKLLCFTEERFKRKLNNDITKLAYATHFAHGIGLEIAILCHKGDPHPASQRFIELCIKKQKEFAVFWPIYRNPQVKSKLIRVNILDEIFDPKLNQFS